MTLAALKPKMTVTATVMIERVRTVTERRQVEVSFEIDPNSDDHDLTHAANAAAIAQADDEDTRSWRNRPAWDEAEASWEGATETDEDLENLEISFEAGEHLTDVFGGKGWTLEAHHDDEDHSLLNAHLCEKQLGEGFVQVIVYTDDEDRVLCGSNLCFGITGSSITWQVEESLDHDGVLELSGI
jgi:hypothetical protein